MTSERPPTRCVRLRKVLIVDRDAFWGPAIRVALEDAGYYLNLVADAREGGRRAVERAYDLVIVSASMGKGAVVGIVESLSRRMTPPCVLILDHADELRLQRDHPDVPCLAILRNPFTIENVVDTTRSLVGVPWSDHRLGA